MWLSKTFSTFGILTNFSWEIHNWTILETTTSVTIFWTRIRVKFLIFRDFWYFSDFLWLFHDFPWPQIFPWLPWLWEPCHYPLSNLAIWPNLSVGSNPVGSLAVIVTFLDPFRQPWTFYWIMPGLSTPKTEIIMTLF